MTRDEFIEQWPGEPIPILGPGKCEGCNAFTQLYATKAREEVFEMCRWCSFIDDAAADAVELHPEDWTDRDRRMEAHDNGLDAA